MSLGALGVPANHMLMGQTHWGVREPEPNCSASRCRVGAGLGSGIEQPRLRPGSPGHQPRFSTRVPELPVRPCARAQGRRGCWAGHGLVFLTGWEASPSHPGEDGTQDKLVPATNSLQIKRLKRIASGLHRHSSACTYSVPARTL